MAEVFFESATKNDDVIQINQALTPAETKWHDIEFKLFIVGDKCSLFLVALCNAYLPIST